MKKHKKQIHRHTVSAAAEAVVSSAVTAPLSYSYLSWFGIPVVLVLATLCVYSFSLRYAFQFDDIDNIVKHFQIRTNTFSGLFFSGTRWISYWINALHYSFGKFDPWSYRLFNVALHCCTGILVFFAYLLGLTSRSTYDFFKKHALLLATMTAGLFLLHPVQTQTVSYVIQGQLEGLAALFVMSMIALFLLMNRVRQKFVRYGLVGVVWVLACFSSGTKEIAIVSPVLLLLVDWFFVTCGSWTSLKKRLWIHALIAATVLFWYVYFLHIRFFVDVFSLSSSAHATIGNLVTQQTCETITPFSFALAQPKVILHYLWIFIYPFCLSVDYDYRIPASLFSVDCLVPLMVLGILLYCIQRVCRPLRTHLGIFVTLWFLICILPRASFIPSSELVADYKTYLASVACMFVLASGIVWLSEKTYAYIHKAFLLSLDFSLAKQGLLFSFLVGLGVSTWQRNQVWSSGLAFWADVIRQAPQKARAYNNYGFELAQQYKQFKEAIPYFQKAVELDCAYADAYNNMAVSYGQVGEQKLALQALQKCLEWNPSNAQAYNNLASFLLRHQQLDEQTCATATAALQKALELRPHYGKALYNLGRIAYARNDYEQAWQCFHDACMKADLDNEMGFHAYAKISLMVKKYDHAIVGYTRALESVPDDQDLLFNLATAHFLADHTDRALTLYEHLLQLYPQDLRAWHNLGELYFNKASIEKALCCFEKTMMHPEEFPKCYLRTAQCYEKLGNYAAAHAMLDKTLKHSCKDSVVTAALTLKRVLQEKECVS